MAFMGLDLGTSGCKSVVYSAEGTYISGEYREYPASRAGGEHELDADLMWNCIREVIAVGAQGCKVNTDGKEEVEAIIVTSFGEAGVPVDKNGKVLHGIVLYTDNKGQAETDALCASAGKENIMRTLCMKPHPMYTLPKILWYKSEHPEIYEKIWKFFLIEDYAVWRLSGEAQVSDSCASRTLAFDVVNKCWSDFVLGHAGVDKSIFSRPVSAGTVAGTILPELCEELNLSPDTLIINGAHDQIAAATGAGALLPGTSVDGMGTVECITPVVDKPFTDPALLNRGYVCTPHSIPGRYATYAFCYCGGALLQWFRDTIAADVKNDAAKQGKSAYQLLDQMIPKDPTDILIMPHFSGSATPYMDMQSKGAVFGLSLETTKGDFYRATMEGVTYEMMLNLEMLRSGGINVKALNAVGGGSRSSVWMQIKADITGLPVNTLENPEAGAIGCIMLGAVAKGRYKNLEEAASNLVRIKKTYEPNEAVHARYAEQFEKYKRIYDAVKTVYGLENPYKA
ncbi:MAG: carbohydrate kinase [Clostridia bacterium]|nr:carbohydrate kinase [Clostridia bacterium]